MLLEVVRTTYMLPKYKHTVVLCERDVSEQMQIEAHEEKT